MVNCLSATFFQPGEGPIAPRPLFINTPDCKLRWSCCRSTQSTANRFAPAPPRPPQFQGRQQPIPRSSLFFSKANSKIDSPRLVYRGQAPIAVMSLPFNPGNRRLSWRSSCSTQQNPKPKSQIANRKSPSPQIGKVGNSQFPDPPFPAPQTIRKSTQLAVRYGGQPQIVLPPLLFSRANRQSLSPPSSSS
jgi:hypothetical protein